MTEERDKFEPKKTGQSNLKLRLLHLLRIPKYRTVPAFILGVSVYLVAYNGFVRWWKGPDHPLNRFGWSQMKSKGELSTELRLKEKVLNDYYTSRIYSISDSPPPSVGY